MNYRSSFFKLMQYNIALLLFAFFLNSKVCCQIPVGSPGKTQALLNEPIDISGDFRNFSNTYYLADSLSLFDPKTGSGKLIYKRYEYSTRQAFDNMLAVLRPVGPNEFPTVEYAVSPSLPFSIEFISSRTMRIRTSSRFQVRPDEESLMIVQGKAQQDNRAWKFSKTDHGYRYTGPYGSVQITDYPWRIEIFNSEGKLITKTIAIHDGAATFTPLQPFSFVRRASDYSTSMNAVFSLSPDEKIFEPQLPAKRYPFLFFARVIMGA